MNLNFADITFTTALLEDTEEGWIALELIRTRGGKSQRAARLIFWDAAGQFFLDSCEGEIPLEILEEFIAHGRTAIKMG